MPHLAPFLHTLATNGGRIGSDGAPSSPRQHEPVPELIPPSVPSKHHHLDDTPPASPPSIEFLPTEYVGALQSYGEIFPKLPEKVRVFSIIISLGCEPPPLPCP
jgi:hypothetical protein